MTKKEKQGRGCLTNRIKEKSKKLFHYEITEQELRLMVHIQYVMCNDQKIDPNKISSDERKILSEWRDREYIEGGVSGLSITKDFWDAICELIFLGYVDIN